MIDVGYSQPTHGATVSDPRVPGGQYNFTLTEQELTIFLGPKIFIGRVDRDVIGFIAAGLKIYGLRSTENASAQGQSFGTNQELALTYGGAARGGVGKRAGPGRIIAELEVAYAPVPETLTGSSNVADVGVQVGYLFVF